MWSRGDFESGNTETTVNAQFAIWSVSEWKQAGDSKSLWQDEKWILKPERGEGAVLDGEDQSVEDDAG